MTVEVIGIGLDGAAGLAEALEQLIEGATLLVGSDRHLNYFPGHRAERLVLGDLKMAIARIRQGMEQNERIVILASGDPLFFGLGRLLLAELPPSRLRFHPHLCSVQLAFNRIKVPWQDAVTLSVHGRTLDELTEVLQQGKEKIALLTDSINNPVAIARHYLALNSPSHYDFWICENLGDVGEKIGYFSAVELENLTRMSASSFAPLNVVILLRREKGAFEASDLRKLPILGLNDRLFVSFSDRPGLMTKKEIRSLVLAELALNSGQTVWDVGAGTGTVAIEIARLCPSSRVYAIEKTAMGINLIEQNSQRLQVANVIPIYGAAPDILSRLPAPERIFIGGSGGKLGEILEICATKLLPGGVLVLTLATVEHLHLSLEWFEGRSWEYRSLQVQIARSTPVKGLTRFMPLNPVTIVTATSPLA